jgi:hypothetical protein
MSAAYNKQGDTAWSPARDHFAVTPHNTTALAAVPKGIYVGGAGDITLRAVGASADVLFKDVPVGTVLPVRAAFIRATGTDATHLVALL